MTATEIVHVIDDDEGVRLALCALLEAKDYMPAPHASGEEFLDKLVTGIALCVVADLRMPGMGGLELQAHLLAARIDLPFIVITGHGDVPSAVRALKSGAADFIEKPVDATIFMTAIDRAAAARRAGKARLEEATVTQKRILALTPRERDVLRHLVAGHPNKIIAYRLDISPRTVENHRAHLMEKMQAESLAELVRRALAGGIEAAP